MPGSFSRAPFPHLITLDPTGLYDKSVLATSSAQLRSHILDSEEAGLTRDFCRLTRETIGRLQPFANIAERLGDSPLTLLPLQVSAHYAFAATARFASQADLLAWVLDRSHPDARILVTQYKSSFSSEAPINAANIDALSRRWPALYWVPEFDTTPSPSQFMLGLVDKVISHSSSILFQAMAWDRAIETVPGSYFSGYATGTDEDIRRNQAVLGFILNRYNVSLASLTSEGFLSDLLEDMLSRHVQGHTGAALLPKLSSIRKDYGTKLLERFDGEKIMAAVSKVNPSVAARVSVCTKFSALISRPEIHCISFDIFDTLILRPTERPDAVFSLVQSEARSRLNISLSEFRSVRIWAEAQARGATSREEITLDEIYANVEAHYRLSREDAKAVQSLECEIEGRLLVPRPQGLELWKIAKNSGKMLVLASDMYLPRATIEHFLSENGFSGYDRLYISNELGATKRTGTLYKSMLDDLGLKGAAVVHVGDNPRGDVEKAEAAGLKSFYIPNGALRASKNPIYAKLFPRNPDNEKAKSIIAGLVNYRFFSGQPVLSDSNTLFGGESWRLGYGALGPFVVGFCQWLHRAAGRDGIERLFFLSREGHLLRDVYNELFGADVIPNDYLYCSRRAARVSCLFDNLDVLSLAQSAFADGSTVGGLLAQRFGLRADAITDYVNERDLASRLPNSIEGRARFASTCMTVSPFILARAAEERSAYLDYLREAGLMEGRVAVVDVGWKANMQASLGRLRGAPVSGYYAGVLAGVEDNVSLEDVSSYLGERIGAGSTDALIMNRKVLEALLCHSSQSLSHMQFREGRPAPQFVPETDHLRRARFIEEVHRGALLFARDFNRFFAAYDQYSLLDWRLNTKILNCFLSEPTAGDAQLLSKLSFEDQFAGHEERALFDRRSSVWPAGARALASEAKIPNGATSPSREASLQLEKRRSLPSLVLRLERWFIQKHWTEQEFQRYLADDIAFFKSTKVPVMKRWRRVRNKTVAMAG